MLGGVRGCAVPPLPRATASEPDSTGVASQTASRLGWREEAPETQELRLRNPSQGRSEEPHRGHSPCSTNAGSLQCPAISQLRQSTGHERPCPGSGASQMRPGRQGACQELTRARGDTPAVSAIAPTWNSISEAAGCGASRRALLRYGFIVRFVAA